MNDSGLSAADVMALTKGSNCSFGDNWIWIIGLLIIAGIFGGGGFGFGNNAGVTEGYIANQFTQRDIAGVNQNMFDGFMNQSNNTKDNLIEILESRANCNANACTTQKEVLENRYSTLLGFKDMQASNDRCCCEIKEAIHADGEATRALIQNNVIQDLRDRIADKDREALATGLSYSQTITTRNSEDRILGNLGIYYPKIGVNPYLAYNYNYGTTLA